MSPQRKLVTAAAFVASVLIAGCSGETAVPIDLNDSSDETEQENTDIPTPNVTHSLPATPEMERLARQQCLDDDSLERGYVQAVDPDSDEVVSEVAVDCAQVRSEG